MELGQLETFLAIARERSFSRAAERLYRTQPAISLALKRLEEELEIWPALGDFLEECCARYGLPVLDYRDTLESVRRLLLNEIRLDVEQGHLAHAVARAEVIRSRIAELSSAYNFPISASLGVATSERHGRTIPALMAAADAALYDAKSAGRNRVMSADRARDAIADIPLAAE